MHARYAAAVRPGDAENQFLPLGRRWHYVTHSQRKEHVAARSFVSRTWRDREIRPEWGGMADASIACNRLCAVMANDGSTVSGFSNFAGLAFGDSMPRVIVALLKCCWPGPRRHKNPLPSRIPKQPSQPPTPFRTLLRNSSAGTGIHKRMSLFVLQ